MIRHANDLIEGYLFRATSGGIGRVAGLAPIEDIDGVENINVTDLVDGHMGYRPAMPKLMKRVGWVVLDDEFEEIEEPVSCKSIQTSLEYSSTIY